MKKIIFLIIFVVLWWSLSLGESLWDISVDFCNTWSDGKTLNFAVQAGIPYEFCVELSTTSKEKAEISLGFVDGQVTNDAIHNKACSYEWSLFDPYVNFPWKKIVLMSWYSIQKTGFLLFPLWYSWEVHWCLVYSLPSQKNKINQQWSFFDVLVRKAKFIDGYVAWDFVREVSFLSWNISYYIDRNDDALIVTLPFVSSWMIPEFLQFTWTLTNVLGYKRSVVSSKVFSWTSVLIFRFSDIPFYQWKYIFSFKWSSLLDTRLDLSYLPEENKKPIFFSYSKALFLIPRILIFEIIGVIFGLFILRFILKLILRR